MINPQKPVINLIKICNRFTALIIYIYICKHTYIQTHIYPHICTYIYIYVCVYIYISQALKVKKEKTTASSLPLLFLVHLLQHEPAHLCTRLYVGQKVFDGLRRTESEQLPVTALEPAAEPTESRLTLPLRQMCSFIRGPLVSSDSLPRIFTRT